MRVHTGVFDPSIVGDKAKWYSHQLDPIVFKCWSDPKTPLFYAFRRDSLTKGRETTSQLTQGTSDDSSTESDGSTSSSYSSLSDFVTELVNSDIDGNRSGK